MRGWVRGKERGVGGENETVGRGEGGKEGKLGGGVGTGELELVEGSWLGKRAKRIGGEGKGGGEKKGNMGGGGEVVKE